ncbi:group II truncated hemoglobin [Corallococcus sp. ZKHCc1 1396]|uniref:Group II truncated hemoglobin n=1 Tax=Corallococcus soli TaxID=2710757 RepID=A0ABR9PR32_9BACT|nr:MULTISPECIES: group II truncated hemoglobin [Corallococcus]MBE4750355.1 group II truncated hemoglobin [Corallococcus soli]MCY1032929.1 group II truncated hemoglobin [Corallococcus sp. BB11-1]
MSIELKPPSSDDWVPTLEDTPFARVGGEEAVHALAEAFYDVMDAEEPALAHVHELDAQGKVNRGTRERFGMFLVGWLGGPQHYSATHGHPRLRMRHGHVPVDLSMRDAWLRCMHKAMDRQGITGGLRRFLEDRFAHTANFLRNTEG